MPGLHEPVAGTFGGDREPVQLARETDREVADVDHLLDLAETLRADLAGLDRDQLAELCLVLTKQLAEAADHVAARRGGRLAPHAECARRTLDGGVDIACRSGGAERPAGDGRARRLVAVG